LLSCILNLDTRLLAERWFSDAFLTVGERTVFHLFSGKAIRNYAIRILFSEGVCCSSFQGRTFLLQFDYISKGYGWGVRCFLDPLSFLELFVLVLFFCGLFLCFPGRISTSRFLLFYLYPAPTPVFPDLDALRLRGTSFRLWSNRVSPLARETYPPMRRS